VVYVRGEWDWEWVRIARRRWPLGPPGRPALAAPRSTGGCRGSSWSGATGRSTGGRRRRWGWPCSRPRSSSRRSRARTKSSPSRPACMARGRTSCTRCSRPRGTHRPYPGTGRASPRSRLCSRSPSRTDCGSRYQMVVQSFAVQQCHGTVKQRARSVASLCYNTNASKQSHSQDSTQDSIFSGC
jgi:hypothetical protein